MSNLSRNTLATILEHKIVAIMRGVNRKDTLQIVNALQNGGIHVIEITLNTPNALSIIEEVSNEFGGKVLVGAGTVLDPESARAAILAGAKFILSPTVNKETIKMAKRYGVVSIPGAFTPTEILTAYEYGGDIVKVFPATLGEKYIADIRGPLSQIPLLPTGGINLGNIRDYLKAGAVGVGLGNSLVNPKMEINELSLSKTTEVARAYVEAVKVD
ncbi:bifunctional 4-hydroxy-2-oxoglutarate aldolase/2-dehydro-3-deoxy-phosphogluconate aldolase [Bacillus sp. MRMR6]|uniref:bifunctional 4-hydroxy-2-oxoglutarate aldolase/2-dehydro-3-deoxy-phosphogluconate aldolase n=1 Tax=Bacillus sp. MRMR6 TaxID=1928617 RepID=UPI0009531D2D|nr:bifunctional 4-hydroxy-2-oxoglutarate aldolase/2-dehydro-3-deoxy-phosphogluconate aldolase [Bacillus sp. MRMR6]OLS40772.1 2-dehydro-3-deoxyphosphogluconate aldolase [Bacillus sp. MRMR6]